MRAVLDPNVIISAVLSPNGRAAEVLRAWLHGRYELVVSPALLDELERALGYSKIRKYVTQGEAAELLDMLRGGAIVRENPPDAPSIRSTDPGDDYLLALAEAAQAVLVSGDRHLLELDDRLPIYSPAAFLEDLPAD